MSSVEITTEVLAKSIDKTKEIVQNKNTGDAIKVKGLPGNYQLINKSASDKDNQLNAMAIAPIVDGKPDYNNVAIVYAGTNTPFETGKNGWWTAAGTIKGDLSGEYKLAEDFLKETKDKIAPNNGTITDVAGFSQSGGYMMKMAAEHGSVDGFKSTSFDDFGKDQFDTLNEKEQEWLNNNPSLLLRYQNDSWAGNSFRDNEYGNVQGIIGIGVHNTLSKYFDGDVLNLDRLAKDGIFAPNMTKQQVEEAAKNWAKKNGDWNPFTNDDSEANARVKKYLKMYGTYATKDFGVQMNKLNRVKAVLFASGGGLSANEQIYLDSEEALIIVGKAKTDFETATQAIVKIYQDAINEVQDLWQEGLSEARGKGSMLEEWEIKDALSVLGFTESNIVTTPCEKYQEKLTKITQMTDKFNSLVTEIKGKIAEVLQTDTDLAQQIKGV